MPRPARTAAALAGLLAGLAAGALPAPASAGPVAQSRLVAPVPSVSTPEVRDGRVQALARVGELVVLGGSFTRVGDRGAGDSGQRFVAAYDRRTGRLVPGFAPVLNGEVFAVLAGPSAGTVYVAGAFTTLGVRAVPRLVLLSLVDGRPVSGFVPAATDAPVRTLARVGDR